MGQEGGRIGLPRARKAEIWNQDGWLLFRNEIYQVNGLKRWRIHV